MRHTDFSVYQQGAATADPLQRNLQNILEDVRIEQALAKPYPGTRETLQAVCARLLADGGFSAPSVDAHPARVLSSYLLLALRHQVLGYAALSAEAAKAEAVLRAVFPARTVRRLQGLMAEAHRLASTAEAVALARRMRALLEDEAQSPAAEPNPSAGIPAEENRSGSNETQQLEPSKATEPAGEPASDGKDTGPTDTNGQPEPNSSEGVKKESTPGPDRAPAGDAGDASAITANADTKETAKQSAVARALMATDADLPGDLFVQARALLEDAAPASSRCVLPQPERYCRRFGPGRVALARARSSLSRAVCWRDCRGWCRRHASIARCRCAAARVWCRNACIAPPSVTGACSRASAADRGQYRAASAGRSIELDECAGASECHRRPASGYGRTGGGARPGAGARCDPRRLAPAVSISGPFGRRVGDLDADDTWRAGAGTRWRLRAKRTRWHADGPRCPLYAAADLLARPGNRAGSSWC